jgi:hypothetical protein
MTIQSLLLITLIGLLNLGSNTIEPNFSNPEKVITIQDRIFIYEPLLNHGLTSFSTSDFEEINRLEFGRGPSQVAGIFNKTLLEAPKDLISFYDRSSGAVQFFDSDLNLKLFHIFRGAMKMPFHVAPISDSTLFIVPNYGNFIELYRYSYDILSESLEIDEKPFFILKPNDNEKLKYLDNFILRQDIHLSIKKNILYLAFEYSDLVVRLEENGNYAVNQFQEDMYGFPNTLDNDGYYNLPTIGEDPVCSLDIDIIDNKLIVLRNGTKHTGSFFSKIFKLDKIMKETDHGKELLVYDIDTLDLLNRITLDTKINNIFNTPNKSFGISSIENDLLIEISFLE